MLSNSYDVITVGGGMAGSSLARNMAESGARVLVLERETQFKDRVRGEALLPWGVGEARSLGVYDALRETCAHEVKWFDFYMGPIQMMHRDLSATTPQQASLCNFYHPRMQQVLIDAAAQAGAEIRRGASVTEIQPGSRPIVRYQQDGVSHEVEARMVVGADGRVSAARQSAGFTIQHDSPSLLLAGILMDHISMPEDTAHLLSNPQQFRSAFLFPQGGGRARAYLAYPVQDHRLHGEDDIPRFVDACVQAGMPSGYFNESRPSGPLASFETADSWVPHPFKNGIALVGDAAASNDPSWGNGMSLSLRSVRILRDALKSTDDWNAAGHQYAEEFDRVYDIIHNVTTWSRQIFMESGPEAEKRRQRAMPRIAQDPTRVPDHGIGGPDLPFDKETTRLRFFGED